MGVGHRWVLLGAVTVVACSSSSAGSPTSDGGSGSDGGAAASDAGIGSGAVSGTADGSPFSAVATSLVLGAPDSPSTTVVYLFSKTVACSDLATPGWDTRITNGTQFLELKSFGTTPATYSVVTTPTPGPGEASVNYTLSSTSGTPMETSASGGTVTLTDVVAGAKVTGSFALSFSANQIQGTFVAAFCPGGHEP